ncbi:MAG: HAD family phosphatase [Actinomycetota bacterium]|nr:HAD family phosphatase [Actinomycetota bacterium]
MILAVIFDLDGLLVDSEQAWNEARKQLTIDRGGRWRSKATREMMGMSSKEWSQYMRDELGVDMRPEDISGAVVELMKSLYLENLPLLPGATEAVARTAARWPLGLASSSNRPLIDLALESSGMGEFFSATVSSEEVARGKPAPDVYLEAARRLSVDAAACAAVEDSHNGILSANAAAMRVIVVPNMAFPPEPDAIVQADAVIQSLDELTQEIIDPTVT